MHLIKYVANNCSDTAESRPMKDLKCPSVPRAGRAFAPLGAAAAASSAAASPAAPAAGSSAAPAVRRRTAGAARAAGVREIPIPDTKFPGVQSIRVSEFGLPSQLRSGILLWMIRSAAR